MNKKNLEKEDKFKLDIRREKETTSDSVEGDFLGEKDVRPHDLPKRRSIRQVEMDRRRRRTFPDGTPGRRKNDNGKGHTGGFLSRKRPSRFPRTLLIAGLSFLVVFSFLFAFNYFAEMRLAVYPRTEIVTLEESSFLASSSSEGVNFEIMTLKDEQEVLVEAVGEEEISLRAQGTITIFNDFSEESQTLIRNTRFESSGGLIYRIEDPVLIPGKTASGPGILEQVPVVADRPGEEYNIGPGDFVVPAFRESGSERFRSITARSNTPMIGGFQGVSLVANEEDESMARDELRVKTKAILHTIAQSEVPQGFVLFEDAYLISFSSLPNEKAGDGSVKIREEGTFSGILFNLAELSEVVAQEFAFETGGDSLLIENFEDLRFAFSEDQDMTKQTKVFQDWDFEFSLSGEAWLVWQFDVERLKSELAGTPRRDINEIISEYPGIEAVEQGNVSFLNRLQRSFPRSTNRLIIERVLVNE